MVERRTHNLGVLGSIPFGGPSEFRSLNLSTYLSPMHVHWFRVAERNFPRGAAERNAIAF